MKKWMIRSFMGGMLALSIGSLTMAKQQGVGAYCKAVHEAYGVPIDVCVNCSNGGNDGAVCICKLYDNLGYPNQGQCVAALHH